MNAVVVVNAFSNVCGKKNAKPGWPEKGINISQALHVDFSLAQLADRYFMELKVIRSSVCQVTVCT